jgi:hypothetical protein
MRLQKLSIIALTLIISVSFIPASLSQEDSPLQGGSLAGKRIYFTEASNEASRFDRTDTGLSHFAGLLSQLDAELLTLEWRTGFPDDADLIIIAGPTRDFSAEQTARLWSYLNNNGSLLLLADSPVNKSGIPGNSQLLQLFWSDMGIRARGDVVAVEGAMQTVEPTPEPAAEGEDVPTNTPAAPVTTPSLVTDFTATNLGDHPIAAGVDGELAFFGARSFEVDSSIQGFTVTALIFSDDEFYGEASFQDYVDTGIAEFNIGTDTARGPLVLAAAYENPTTGSRMVLIGDRDFVLNGKGLQTSPPNSASFLSPANAQFLLNTVAWLLEAEPAEASFPTPGPTVTPTITPSPTPTPLPTPTPTPGDGEGEG